MQVPVIKKLVENHSLEELQAAEEKLSEEQEPDIPIEGEDMGEQLTHAIAAAQVKQDVEENGTPIGKAVRNYTQRVRKSIS